MFIDNFDISKQPVLDYCLSPMIIIHKASRIYFPSLVLATREQFATMPGLSHDMYRALSRRANNLVYEVREQTDFALKVRRLETVTGAIERDQSDPRHPALSHVFREHIRDNKESLKELYNEALRANIMKDEYKHPFSRVNEARVRFDPTDI